MTDFMHEISRQASMNLAAQTEAIIREALDRHLGPGWTVPSLLGRMRLTRFPDGREIASIDETALVEFMPVEMPVSATHHLKIQRSYRIRVPAP